MSTTLAPLTPASTSPAVCLPAISCAFQPIVDTRAHRVLAYEALVRGAQGEDAAAVLDRIRPSSLAAFDEHCRVVALQCAARLGLTCDINLNLMPHAVQPGTDCLASTLYAAHRNGIEPGCLVLEVTEQELLADKDRFAELTHFYRGEGMRLALDDFGSGYSGLNLLAEFQPDQLKLDKTFARGIARSGPRQAIVRAIIQVCRDLGIDLIAEGVESVDEYTWFRDEGVYQFQGFLFGRPGFESLPVPHFL